MRKNEIARLAQMEVLDLMASGFHISLSEATGSQSDVFGTQTVFARGRERAVLYATFERGGDGPDEATLKLARFEAGGKDDGLGWLGWASDWDEHVVKSWKVYNCSNEWCEADWWVEDEGEAKAALELHGERKREHLSDVDVELRWYSVEVTPRIMGAVRKLKGFKTAKADEVRIRKYNCPAGVRYKVSKTTTGTAVALG